MNYLMARGRIWWLVVLIVFAAFGVIRLLDGGDGRPDQTAIPLPGGKTVTADTDQQVERGDQEAAPAADTLTPASSPTTRLGVHEDERDELPGRPGLDRPDAKRLDSPPGAGPRVELGGAQNYSCPNHFVRNHSALLNRQSMFTIHFTVSAPGSLNAIRRLFNTSSFGASSDFGLELSGRCERWVPPGRKAWTQGAFNPFTRSVEIVTFDRTRRQWLNDPIIKRGILAALIADNLKAVGAPPKLVDPVGCNPKAGWTDHDHLECGNNHTDVGDGFPFDVVSQQVVRAYYGGNPVKPAAPPVTPKALSYCKQLNRYRRVRAGGGKLTPGQATRQARLKRALERKYRCGRRGATTVIARK